MINVRELYSTEEYQGVGLGGAAPPLFLDKTEAWRAEKVFWRLGSPLSKCLDDRDPLLSQGLDLALQHADGKQSESFLSMSS